MESRKLSVVHRLRGMGFSLLLGAVCSSGFSAGAIAQSKAVDAGPVSDTCYVDGWSESLRCYQIPVSEAGGVALSVLVAPAVNGGHHEPLYLLAGGPGQAASDLARLLNPLRKLNRGRDIVLVDRRGAGRSNAFDCGLGDDEFIAQMDRFVSALKECRSAAGERPLSINSRQTVEDLETVRKALGHGRISLWGGSWGTRTALLYQQWYPESLQSLILDGVAPIDTRVFLAAQAAESALQQLEQACSADPVCADFGNWRGELDVLLANWSDEQAHRFPDPFTGAPSETPVEDWIVASAVRTALYDPGAAALLPFAVHQASRGNFAPLSGILGLFAHTEGGMSMGLTFSVACAEELNRMSADDIAKDAADTFIGDSFIRTFVEGCKVWPVPAQPYEKPEERAHPVLLISGSADPITPPGYAERDLEYLPNRQHLVVEGGGHINSTRGCVPNLILEFLDQPDTALDDSCLADIERPPFAAGAYGPELMLEAEPVLADNRGAAGEGTADVPGGSE